MGKKVVVIPDESSKILTLFSGVALLIGAFFFTYVAVKDLFSSNSYTEIK